MSLPAQALRQGLPRHTKIERASERGRAKQPMQQEQSVPKEQRGKEGRGAATAGSIPFEKYNRGSYTSGDGTNEWMHNGDK